MEVGQTGDGRMGQMGDGKVGQMGDRRAGAGEGEDNTVAALHGNVFNLLTQSCKIDKSKQYMSNTQQVQPTTTYKL